MSIEREQPSTAFQSMPHYTTYGGSYLSAQFVDEQTGTLDALNETTNFRPTKGESISIVHPAFKTGYDTDSIDSLSETVGDGDPRILGPISGEGVFKAQDIDAKGSVIVGDNHFMPDRGGDRITGEGRPMSIWTNGGASTFQDRLDVGPVNKTADKGWWTVDGADFRDSKLDARNNEFPAVDIWTTGGTASVKNTVPNGLEGQAFLKQQVSLQCNIDWIAANGGPGSSYLAETFVPAAGMDSFGKFDKPDLADGGFQPLEGASVGIGQPTDPKLWLQMLD